MTAISLNWWAKNGHESRVYVNLAGSRESLGYFCKRTNYTARGNSSYYDRHRNAKGDDTVISDEPTQWFGPEGLDLLVLAAIGLTDERLAGMDDWAVYRTLEENAAGFKTMGWGANKKETDRKNEARKHLVFEIEMQTA